eukprot:RCo041560
MSPSHRPGVGSIAPTASRAIFVPGDGGSLGSPERTEERTWPLRRAVLGLQNFAAVGTSSGIPGKTEGDDEEDPEPELQSGYQDSEGSRSMSPRSLKSLWSLFFATASGEPGLGDPTEEAVVVTTAAPAAPPPED